MARAYTAWVVQEGKGEDAVYVSDLTPTRIIWSAKLAKAMQFVRRSDARRFTEGVEAPIGRPVEKSFG